MDMQNVSNLQIPEGAVRTIHDKDSRLIWGRLAYDTKYAGNTLQNGTPTTDAPIPVQVVTGEQTVKVTGKNLFDNSLPPIYSTGANSEPLSTGMRINTTEALGNSFCCFRLFKSSDFVGKTITLSANVTASASNQPNAYIGLCAENGSSRVAKVFMTGTGEKSASYTHTAEDTSRPYIMVALYSNYAGGASQVGDYADFNNLQLEVGSATAYEPYQSQSYAINLGSIELCKISDYQDYIYKSGDDWYVHKACGKVVFDGSENWARNDANEVFTLADAIDYNSDGTTPYSNYFMGQSEVSSFARIEDLHIGLLQSATNNRTIVKYTAITSASAFKTWLSSHNTTVYYPLATPTDTKITDATLIGQLNAVHEWLTRYGYSSNVTGNLPIIIDRTNL